jgi:histidine ammonia-lyase
MGWSAGRKLRRALDGLSQVLAVEAMTAARGLDLRAPLRPGPATSAVLAAIRRRVPGPGPDRHVSEEIAAAVDLVRSGELVTAAQSVTGPWEPESGRSAQAPAEPRAAGEDP